MGDLPAHQQDDAPSRSGRGRESEPSLTDRRWWTETVETYLAPMYRHIRARVPAEVVDDLVQETFVSAARSAWRFDRGRASEWRWLVAIARSRIVDYYRARGRDPLLCASVKRLEPELADIEAALAAGSPLPDELCAAEEFRRIVRAALSSLEPKLQACLVARYYNGLSLNEVSQLMGVSPSAANSLLHRARGRLREAVKKLIRGRIDIEEFTR